MAYSVLTHQDRNFIIDHYDLPRWKVAVKRCILTIKSPLYRMALKVWKPVPVAGKKYYVSLCAIFKDEAPNFKEWIEYHRIVGVEHFYLYNNNSTDNYMDVLQPYIDEGLVTLTDWPQIPGQQGAYEHFVKTFRHETQWVSFLDLDEFFCPKQAVSLPEWLSSHGDYPVHMIYWRMFGTQGHMKSDSSRLTTEQCTVCWPKLDTVGKLLYNTDYEIVRTHRAMHHELSVKVGPLSVPPVNQFGRFVEYNIHRAGGEMDIQLNHYWSVSYESYVSKHRKGDVAYVESWKTFDKFLLHEHHNTSCDYAIYRFLIELKLRMGLTE